VGNPIKKAFSNIEEGERGVEVKQQAEKFCGTKISLPIIRLYFEFNSHPSGSALRAGNASIKF